MATSPVAIAREFELEPADNARLASLCGPLDANLRLLESRLDVQIRRRGHGFRVQGLQAEAAERALRELHGVAAAGDVSPEQVHLCIVEQGLPRAPAPRDDAAKGAAQSDRSAHIVRTPRGLIHARGAHQQAYLASIRERDLTFGIGPAGTGKTYLAVACAVEALTAEQVRRLVLVRPAVEAGERLGFLPGDLAQKVDPYLRPIYDALYEMLGFDRVARLIERAVIEVAPLAFMRGRSLNDSFIILDEAQNTTTEQMKMFLTRIGFGSRAVVTGDVTQTDLPAGRPSGLRHALHILRDVSGVAFNHFDAADVVRHPLVQRIVRAYESQGPSGAEGAEPRPPGEPRG
ncbi:MAG: PhoH family protein [Proteobacteria bacterium]|nr:PhoH family protein [Pseudomonadota bacterium]